MERIWTDLDGLRVHALAGGREGPPAVPPVVLVHGVAVSSRNVRPTAEALSPHCTVFAPDLPGHGLSDHPPRVLRRDGLADSLADWLSAMGLERASLLGNSYGCQIIVEFARRHPERLDRAVLQGPTTDLRPAAGPAPSSGG